MTSQNANTDLAPIPDELRDRLSFQGYGILDHHEGFYCIYRRNAQGSTRSRFEFETLADVEAWAAEMLPEFARIEASSCLSAIAEAANLLDEDHAALASLIWHECERGQTALERLEVLKMARKA